MATAVLIGIAGLVSACTVQPLYGPTPTGSTVPDVLASIAVDEVDTRIAQVVRNKVIFDLTGGEQVADPAYRMKLKVSSQEISLGITREESAPVYSIIVTATYEISDAKTGLIVLRSTARGNASYNRINQIFANVRGRIDAEEKAAGIVADEIRIRVAAASAQGTI
jgi:LPS-assembly lipoprotein